MYRVDLNLTNANLQNFGKIRWSREKNDIKQNTKRVQQGDKTDLREITKSIINGETDDVRVRFLSMLAETFFGWPSPSPMDEEAARVDSYRFFGLSALNIAVKKTAVETMGKRNSNNIKQPPFIRLLTFLDIDIKLADKLQIFGLFFSDFAEKIPQLQDIDKMSSKNVEAFSEEMIRFINIMNNNLFAFQFFLLMLEMFSQTLVPRRKVPWSDEYKHSIVKIPYFYQTMEKTVQSKRYSFQPYSGRFFDDMAEGDPGRGMSVSKPQISGVKYLTHDEAVRERENWKTKLTWVTSEESIEFTDDDGKPYKNSNGRTMSKVRFSPANIDKILQLNNFLMALCNDECFYNDWNVNVHDKIVALLKKHSGEGDPLGPIDLKVPVTNADGVVEYTTPLEKNFTNGMKALGNILSTNTSVDKIMNAMGIKDQTVKTVIGTLLKSDIFESFKNKYFDELWINPLLSPILDPPKHIVFFLKLLTLINSENILKDQLEKRVEFEEAKGKGFAQGVAETLGIIRGEIYNIMEDFLECKDLPNKEADFVKNDKKIQCLIELAKKEYNIEMSTDKYKKGGDYKAKIDTHYNNNVKKIKSLTGNMRCGERRLKMLGEYGALYLVHLSDPSHPRHKENMNALLSAPQEKPTNHLTKRGYLGSDAITQAQKNGKALKNGEKVTPVDDTFDADFDKMLQMLGDIVDGNEGDFLSIMKEIGIFDRLPKGVANIFEQMEESDIESFLPLLTGKTEGMGEGIVSLMSELGVETGGADIISLLGGLTEGDGDVGKAMFVQAGKYFDDFNNLGVSLKTEGGSNPLVNVVLDKVLNFLREGLLIGGLRIVPGPHDNIFDKVAATEQGVAKKKEMNQNWFREHAPFGTVVPPTNFGDTEPWKGENGMYNWFLSLTTPQNIVKFQNVILHTPKFSKCFFQTHIFMKMVQLWFGGTTTDLYDAAENQNCVGCQSLIRMKNIYDLLTVCIEKLEIHLEIFLKIHNQKSGSNTTLLDLMKLLLKGEEFEFVGLDGNEHNLSIPSLIEWCCCLLEGRDIYDTRTLTSNKLDNIWTYLFDDVESGNKKIGQLVSAIYDTYSKGPDFDENSSGFDRTKQGAEIFAKNIEVDAIKFALSKAASMERLSLLGGREALSVRQLIIRLTKEWEEYKEGISDGAIDKLLKNETDLLLFVDWSIEQLSERFLASYAGEYILIKLKAMWSDISIEIDTQLEILKADLLDKVEKGNIKLNTYEINAKGDGVNVSSYTFYYVGKPMEIPATNISTASTRKTTVKTGTEVDAFWVIHHIASQSDNPEHVLDLWINMSNRFKWIMSKHWA